MNTPNTLYNGIRPYYNSELKEALTSLLIDEEFRGIVSNFAPHINLDDIQKLSASFQTLLDFQKAFVAPILKSMIGKLCNNFTSSGLEYIEEQGLFMSNHRDIVVDPTFLCYNLILNGKNTCEIGIGDNLLKKEWIRNLVRVNKCFIVKRDLEVREMAKTFVELSSYINHTIKDNGNTVWIAQREGRAKDSNDRTQESILKMFALGGNGTFIERIKALNIQPLAISYEFDPCDYLKAQEFQLRRDNLNFKKGKEDDLISMKTGIMGYKGDIHYAFTPCINSKLETLERGNLNKKEQAAEICKICDEQIFEAYKIFPINIVALEMLAELDGEYSAAANKLTNEYLEICNDENRDIARRYIYGQLAKINIDNKDESYLLRKLLEMYANPLINQLSINK